MSDDTTNLMNIIMLEGVARMALGIIKYYDFLGKSLTKKDILIAPATFSDNCSGKDCFDNLDDDCSDNLDADFDDDMNDTFSEDSVQMKNINHFFKHHRNNLNCFIPKEAKYQHLVDVKNICIKNQNECDAYQNFLYVHSMALIRVMESDVIKKDNEYNPIKLNKENTHNKSFSLSYFNTFTLTINEKITNQSDNVEFIEKFLKLYAEPCVMFILCFINHCDKLLSIDELKNVLLVMKFLESQLTEVTDLSAIHFPKTTDKICGTICDSLDVSSSISIQFKQICDFYGQHDNNKSHYGLE